MKKLTVWALLLAMVVAMFAGCSNNTPAETTAPATEEPVSKLADAVYYVRSLYKKSVNVTAKDYEVIGSVTIGGDKFDIAWSVDVAEDVVAIVPNENGMVTINVNEDCPEETPYILTATLTDGEATEALTWEHTVPAALNVDGLTYAEIVDMAYALEDQAATEDTFRLYGTVTSIDTEWNPDYQNITVTIVVAGREEQPIQCYRLKGEGAADLKVGDAITVEGILKNYKGTYEFDAGCVLVGYGEFVDQKLLMKAAFALEDGAALNYPAVVTGVVTEIVSEYSEQYGNITVNLDIDGQVFQCYRLKGEGVADLAVGDTITAAGIIKNYKGTIEFDAGCVLVPNDMYHSVKNALSGYKLQEGEAQEGVKTITGTIATIDTEWNPDYQNITVTIVVAGLEDYPIMCYRLSGEGAADLAVGDTITVTGVLKNYKGTIEFDAGCTLGAVLAAAAY